MDVRKLLAVIEQEMQRYSPPRTLLYTMNPTVSPDKEYLSYVLKGGAGGYYRWLALLTSLLRPHCILELGNRYGISTTMIWSELPEDSHLISVDIVRDQRYVPEEMWQDARVRFVFGDCLDLSIYGDEVPIDVDVLWTDTMHTYQQVRDEFDVYEPLLSDQALIVVDDIRLNDKGRFFEEAPWAKWDLTTLCHSSGFGVLHYVRGPGQYQDEETRKTRAALASAGVWKRRADAFAVEVGEAVRREDALAIELEEAFRREGVRKYVRAVYRLVRSMPVCGGLVTWLRSHMV